MATAGPAPPNSAAVVLASSSRGDIVETVHRGHIAVVDADGAVVAALGDPGTITPMRSCAKPLQALPFVTSAMDAMGATPSELALACASHNGEEAHVATARSLLSRAGVDENELECGPQLPIDEGAARHLLASGGVPLPIHNNCSGQHAAMLATCAVLGLPRAGYVERDHPLQGAITAMLSRHTATDLATAPWGIDGCGLPTFGVRLAALALAFATAQAATAEFQRCQDAMAAHPFEVAGTGRFDTALLAACGDRLTAKIGGAGVWVALLRPAGPAVAVKLESGAGEAVPPVALAVLRCLGALPEPLPEALQPFAAPVLRNWAGAPIGRIHASIDLL
jgi:L-asparaginase II